LIVAVIAAVWLLVFDLIHRFDSPSKHQQASAIALMAVGAAYVFVHLLGRLSRGARLRAVLLGGAFFIWGAEQFMKPGSSVTAIDCVIILIFVFDLGSSVSARLKSKNENEE
jgi:hypothetical protein